MFTGSDELFSPCLAACSDSSLRYPVLPPCPAMFPTFPGPFSGQLFTFNTKCPCTTTSLPGSHLVRDKRLTVTRQISNPLHPAYDHRCLYHSLRCLGLCHPVSQKRMAMHADSRWLSGANQASLRLRLECSCLESQLSCSPWQSLHWYWRQLLSIR
jgi:hypothetical protein